MIDRLISAITALIVTVIAALGYPGVVLMMALESACIPLPSEVIMPFAGYLVATGRMTLNAVAFAGALGCLLGSYAAYYAGAYGGRRALERYGRYLLITPHELETADWFFERWGAHAVFTARLLPVVRTFIALPAGVARMRIVPFTVYTLAGSYLWCLALAWAGMKLGQNWNTLSPYFHRFNGAVVALAAAGAGVVLYKRLKGIRAARRAEASQ